MQSIRHRHTSKTFVRVSYTPYFWLWWEGRDKVRAHVGCPQRRWERRACSPDPPADSLPCCSGLTRSPARSSYSSFASCQSPALPQRLGHVFSAHPAMRHTCPTLKLRQRSEIARSHLPGVVRAGTARVWKLSWQFPAASEIFIYFIWWLSPCLLSVPQLYCFTRAVAPSGRKGRWLPYTHTQSSHKFCLFAI